MSVHNPKRNEAIITKHRRHDKDCGSSEVQIALMTDKLERLSAHFEKFPQDTHSKRGLLRTVANRKNLLAYLKNESAERYKSVVSSLGLRK